jgi:hypothetical protein
MAVRGIYGRPTVCLDGLVDVDGLMGLHDSIVDGCCVSERHHGLYGLGCREKDKYHDMAWAEKAIENLQPDHPHSVAYGQLRQVADRKLYLKMIYGVYSGFYSIPIKVSDNFRKKHLHAEWHGNAKYFAPLIAWIEQLDIFESYGRVHCFLTEHDCVTVEHSDYLPIDGHQAEMIWIRTRLDKGLYVMDRETLEKHHVQGYTAFFNEQDIHGAESSPRMTVSLRIDGVFTKNTRRALGIPDDPSY